MKFYIVDCFAEEKYQGNQLAVFIPDYDITSEEMQKIAHEMNFSETTFILSDKQENGGYLVKIFTPDIEIPFAGHPTLGTAYIINKIIENDRFDTIILNLGVGPIAVSADADKLIMRQNEPEFGQIVQRKAVAKMLQIGEEDIRADFDIQWVSTGLPCFVVPLKTSEAVKRCALDHALFQRFLTEVYKCNVLVFTQEEERKLKVRVFMDDPGFLEDPATGSANGNLAGYLLKHNFFHDNILQYSVEQGAEVGRPSLLNVSAELSDGKYSIMVGGRVCLVADGNW